jgi:hypothetical protein
MDSILALVPHKMEPWFSSGLVPPKNGNPYLVLEKKNSSSNFGYGN